MANPYRARLAFFGPMCSGKSWCANYLVQSDSTVPWRKFSFAAKLKTIAYELYEVSGKDAKSRAILQQLGEKLRELDSNVWINYALREIARYEETHDDNIVIDDLRYINEGKILEAAGFTLVQCVTSDHIRRNRIEALYGPQPEETLTHPSETEWMYIRPNFFIDCDNPTSAAEGLARFKY